MADAKPTSKIVQIALAYNESGPPEAYFLCADGSVWEREDGEWFLHWPAPEQPAAPDLAAEIADLHDIVQQLSLRLAKLEADRGAAGKRAGHLGPQAGGQGGGGGG
jgi:hypothetical protein